MRQRQNYISHERNSTAEKTEAQSQRVYSFVPEHAESGYETDVDKENLRVTAQVLTLMDLFCRIKRNCLFAFTFKDLTLAVVFDVLQKVDLLWIR